MYWVMGCHCGFGVVMGVTESSCQHRRSGCRRRSRSRGSVTIGSAALKGSRRSTLGTKLEERLSGEEDSVDWVRGRTASRYRVNFKVMLVLAEVYVQESPEDAKEMLEKSRAVKDSLRAFVHEPGFTINKRVCLAVVQAHR